jgi:hypothetical protein
MAAVYLRVTLLFEFLSILKLFSPGLEPWGDWDFSDTSRQTRRPTQLPVLDLFPADITAFGRGIS